VVEVRRAPALSLETPATGATEVVEVRSAPALSLETSEANPDTPLKVLFVCTANICRSPYMEVAARALVTDGSVTFSSAGTHGFRDKPINPPMAAVLDRLGLDASDFRSRPLTRQMVEEADLVLTAEATHRSFILDESPEAFRKVFTLGQCAEAITRHDEELAPHDLLAALGERRGPADVALDVADPYGRGDVAAAEAGSKIDELLRVVVGSLTRTRSI